LEGLTQAVVRALPKLSALSQDDNLDDKQRRSRVRAVLKEKLLSGWQEVLDEVTDVVHRILPDLADIADHRVPSEKVTWQVRQLLRRELDRWQLYDLFYWHYDMPQDDIRLAVTRYPSYDIKPMLDWAEYAGLFLTRLKESVDKPKKR
jgi:hypothetical protein